MGGQKSQYVIMFKLYLRLSEEGNIASLDTSKILCGVNFGDVIVKKKKNNDLRYR